MSKRLELVIFIICWVLVLSLYAVNSYLQDQLSTQGASLGKIQEEIKTLTISNQQLYDELLKYEAYTTISEEASQAGYMQQDKYLIVK